MEITNPGLKNITKNEFYTFSVKAVNEKKLAEIQNIWKEKNSSDQIPYYFEQVEYKLKIIAKNSKQSLKFKHYRQDIVDALTDADEPQRLAGNINFRNNVGLFEFLIEVRNKEDSRLLHTSSYRWNVYPRKLDSQKDYISMVNRINEAYPSWIWSASSVTQNEASASSGRNKLNLIWLQLFFTVGEEFIAQVNSALNAPHNKLSPNVKYLRADRIWKIKGKQEEKISEWIEKDPNKKFRIEKQISTQDTFENRWLKSAVKGIGSKLSEIDNLISESKNKLNFSDDIQKRMKKQILQLKKAERHSVLKSVGLFRSMDRESLVLHHRYGYDGAYRYWLILKKQIELLENSNYRIGLKQISDLYEVWCLLEMKNIICGNKNGYKGLEFTETRSVKAALYIKELEYQLKKGMGASFQFVNDEGVVLTLAHEPRYSKKGFVPDPEENRIVSFTGLQKPDIWLEAKFRNGLKVVYVFDAKYRIQFQPDSFNTQTDDEVPIDYNKLDLVPVDALNQLHRYRDAIIYLENRKDRIEYGDRNRLIAGGFALYPGVYNQNHPEIENPYDQSINEIGIGAFPFIPGSDGNNSWLEKFLRKKLCTPLKPEEVKERGIGLIDHRSVRIPPRGITQRIDKKGLTMLIPLGSKRTDEYINSFLVGEAEFYHTRAAEFRKNGVSRNRAKEIEYIAFSVKGKIKNVYKVLSVDEVTRDQISTEQAGNTVDSKSNNDRRYLTFDIEYYKTLSNVINKQWGYGNFHSYTYLDDLMKAESFEQLIELYKHAEKN